MTSLPRNEILIGDARAILPTLPEHSVDCVITSPPYFRLRNYQHEEQIGLEEHVDEWVEQLLQVAKELARVLKPTGSFWLNLGDAYASKPSEGTSAKSLILSPERVALALVADGWLLRNKVVWAKTNPMPTSVRDRLSCTYEVVYYLVRDRNYYFDLNAVRVPHRTTTVRSGSRRIVPAIPDDWRGPLTGRNTGLSHLKAKGLAGHPLGKNPGDVWQLATAGYRGRHHAVFPEKLVELPLLATCPAKVCSSCGSPWTNQSVGKLGRAAVIGALGPRCDCGAPAQPGIVLDPFLGSGTVAAVARRHRRHWLGIELNPAFAKLAEARLRRGTAPKGSDQTARQPRR